MLAILHRRSWPAAPRSLAMVTADAPAAGMEKRRRPWLPPASLPTGRPPLLPRQSRPMPPSPSPAAAPPLLLLGAAVPFSRGRAGPRMQPWIGLELRHRLSAVAAAAASGRRRQQISMPRGVRLPPALLRRVCLPPASLLRAAAPAHPPRRRRRSQNAFEERGDVFLHLLSPQRQTASGFCLCCWRGILRCTVPTRDVKMDLPPLLESVLD